MPSVLVRRQLYDKDLFLDDNEYSVVIYLKTVNENRKFVIYRNIACNIYILKPANGSIFVRH